MKISATYRLQFNKNFTLKHAIQLVDYFASLGISHLYASPIFKARAGSLHGYDIVDYNCINPEIGTEEDLCHLARALKSRKMGLILDFVPNHMAICQENAWWMDVLEDGIHSKYASYFDINWKPLKIAFKNKIFLPILERPFGQALENGELPLAYADGKFFVNYKNWALPTTMHSWPAVLHPFYLVLLKKGFRKQHSVKALLALIEKLRALKIYENKETKQQIATELDLYFKANLPVFEHFKAYLAVFNGQVGQASSFDALECFFKEQHYRLCFWKVANDEINYRRFFDICDYACLTMQNKDTFREVHQKLFHFIKKGWVYGLRIDHIDGLWDPQEYLENLHKFAPRKIKYLIVEKILLGNEQMRPEWPINGSVGYEFLNQLNGLFIFRAHKQNILDIYQRFIAQKENVSVIKYECKKLILKTTLASELNFLINKLVYLAANHRSSQDFTWQNLRNALIEIIAWFPVYRSYIRSHLHEIHTEDYLYIHVAVERAKKYCKEVDPSIFNFIQDVLLLKFPNAQKSHHKAEFNRFIMHFQQITGPVMAKGYEDTTFYRYYPLAMLAEVGAESSVFGMTIENFHKKNIERLQKNPLCMLATDTHDTKRSKDFRARINVLSEIPERWEIAIHRWRELNQHFKVSLDEELVPHANEEYLIYQTLLGTWPLEGFKDKIEACYIERIQNYMEKAIKEAKLHSSWIDANEAYHEAVKQFIHKILDFSAAKEFIMALQEFFMLIRDCSMLTAIAQVIIKITAPGIPDFYQGNELWCFRLVDPDNRQPVDFALRRQLISTLHANLGYEDLINGKVKLWFLKETLAIRNKSKKLFTEGDYVPIEVQGVWAENVICFARHLKNEIVLVIVCRFFTNFMQDFFNYQQPLSQWTETYLVLPAFLAHQNLVDVYTQQSFDLEPGKLSLQPLLQKFPFAVLHNLK